LLTSDRNVNHRKIIIENNAIRINESRHVDFTGETNGASILLYNNIILIDGRKEVALYRLKTLLDNVTDCDGNTFVIVEMDADDQIELDCGVVEHDKAIWEQAKNVWLDGVSVDKSSFDVGTSEDAGETETVLPPYVVESNLVAQEQIEIAEAQELRSNREAIAAAQRMLETVDAFLNRWSDNTFWQDGTGWVE
jgi:hypothetical protein